MDLDGHRREFDATITERSPDERLSWSTTDGPLLAETLTLRPIGETRTQVVAQLEADIAFLSPSGRHGQETLNRRLKSDLDTFKSLCENGKFGTRLGCRRQQQTTLRPVQHHLRQRPVGRPGRAGVGPGPGPSQAPGRTPRRRLGYRQAGRQPDIRNGGPATARPGTANRGQNVDITSAPGSKDAHDLDDVLAPGRRIASRQTGGSCGRPRSGTCHGRPSGPWRRRASA